MPTPPEDTALRKSRSLPVAPIAAGVLALVLLLAGLIYLNKPTARTAESAASPEAKAYLSNLQLKDVTMKATENFMKQRVVEIEGGIGNNGPRALRSIDIYCLFYGVDGRELHRERVAVLPATAAPLKPGETRHFRLPFDDLPTGWNQALPRMVIAQLSFAG